MQERFNLKKLKEFLETFPDEDPVTGEEYEVWISSGDGRIVPITSIRILNKVENSADILLETTKEIV